MDTVPLVTVLIPTYNQAAYIGAAIASALSQDHPNLEVIVADDASTDHTAGIVASFHDARLRYEPSQRNLGRAANYRRGLYELARGEWVLNLDGDDFLVDPSFIRAALAAVNDSVTLVAADRHVADSDAAPPGGSPCSALSVSPEYLDGTQYVLSLPRPRFHIHHLAALYRRRDALPIDFYRADIVSCDYESIYRLLLGRRLVHLPCRVAVWRRHAGNASRAHGAEQTIQNYQLFQGVRDFAVQRLGASAAPLFDAWLQRNVSYRFYGNLLSYSRNLDFAGLREVSQFLKSRHPAARRRALANPRNLVRCMIAVATGVVHRAREPGARQP